MCYVQSFSHLAIIQPCVSLFIQLTTNQSALQTTAAQKASLGKLFPSGRTAGHRLSTEELIALQVFMLSSYEYLPISAI